MNGSLRRCSCGNLRGLIKAFVRKRIKSLDRHFATGILASRIPIEHYQFRAETTDACFIETANSILIMNSPSENALALELYGLDSAGTDQFPRSGYDHELAGCARFHSYQRCHHTGSNERLGIFPNDFEVDCPSPIRSEVPFLDQFGGDFSQKAGRQLAFAAAARNRSNQRVA